ncbi:hypothetical protein TKK_0005515 [Trichogramma kaykai]
MQAAFDLMYDLEEFCGLKSYFSEQHVDLLNHRMNRDDEDVRKLLLWIDKHDLFRTDSQLISVSSGVIGDESINCHMATELGKKSMATMIEKSACDISLSTKFKVKPLSAATNGAHVRDEEFINVDPQILFQRIIHSFQGNEHNTREAFEYELSPYPLSIFDECGMMRKNKKAELSNLFKTHVNLDPTTINFYITDGG